jgi:hypothetical protein
MKEVTFSPYDAQVVAEATNFYYTGQEGDAPLPIVENYPAPIESNSFTLPEGWWIMLVLGALVNIIIYFIFNRKS